jgi:hypothetical protein
VETTRTIDYRDLPLHMQGAMQRWVENGIHPGGFLTAVLENDFVMAVSRADSVNKQNLVAYVTWLTTHAPYGCWGDRENVSNWKGLQGE